MSRYLLSLELYLLAMTHKYLLEIGTEELPAPQIPMMLNQLTESLTRELTNLNLTPKVGQRIVNAAQTGGDCRRLAR